MAKVIFHLDINSFFASAHLIENPELKGKPVVVCNNSRSAVITTASYEARVYGVHSAMPLVQAKRLCPEVQVVDLDFELYQDLSQQFMSILASYSPIIQQASIDECYVDMTETIKKYKRPLDLAVAIQEQVEQELLLPISIGIGPNRFLAKMASDMHKPKGITVLRLREVEEKLWPLPIESMFGIGKKTVPLLKRLKIQTIGDLAQASLDDVQAVLGINAHNFIERAHGRGSDHIEVLNERKSIGQSRTYSQGLVSEESIREALMIEIQEVVRRLKQKDVVGRTLTFAIRLDSFLTASRSITVENYLEEANDIFERCMHFYDEFEGEGAVTFLSVAISNLVNKEDVVNQITLFENMATKTTDEVIARLNKELQGPVFKSASSLLEGDHE